MVQRQEGHSDAQNIGKNLIESIINEVFKTINERADSCYNSFEGMKLQTYGTENIMDCVIVKGVHSEKLKELENQDTINLNPHLSDICYPNIPEVCRSSTSKQGDGDYQSPPIRETTAFYCLGKDKYNHQNFGGSDSSLNVEMSSNDLIESLHERIHNLTFDDIHLSDSEADDGLLSSVRYSVANEYLKPSHSNNGNFNNNQNVIQHSQKFCQINNTHYFPYNNSTSISSYCTLVNEDYDEERTKNNDDNDEEQELLSGSSQELVTVEGESDQVLHGIKFSSKNPFHPSSTIALSSHCFPDTISLDSKRSVNESNAITVTADVERRDWEEALEVQVNVTEPAKCTEPHDIEDDIILRRRYWSNVGLISENKVNPQYLGPVETPGIESVPGVTPVEIKRLKQQPEEEIWVTEPQSQDEDEEALFNKAFITDDSVNYLSYSKKTGKEKKKKKFITRLTNSISNVLRLRRRSSKH